MQYGSEESEVKVVNKLQGLFTRQQMQVSSRGPAGVRAR